MVSNPQFGNWSPREYQHASTGLLDTLVLDFEWTVRVLTRFRV